MMRVLLTGGSGYIGGRLRSVLAKSSDVHVTAAGRDPRSHDGHITVDWTNRASIEAVCRDQDAIVHLAAMNEADCERDPEAALRTNAGATLALLRAGEAAGVRRFIYLSTIKVFGQNPAGVLSESSLPEPRSHYAISHRAAEEYVLAAHAMRKLQGVVLRLSNAIGPPVHAAANAWTLIANDLCRQAVSTARLTLNGSGLAWRNFVALRDVTGAIRHALLMPDEALDNGLFNLGGDRSLRVFDLAQQIADRAQEVIGRRIVVSARPATTGESHPMLEWRIDKLMRTGWTPRFPLSDEIDATLHFCNEQAPSRSRTG